MIALLTSMADQRGREMRDYAASRRRASEARRQGRPASRSAGPIEELSIRYLDAAGSDRGALQHLAGRDSAAVPAGEVLGAERRGRLIAAVSLSTGEVVADPFIPTTAARALLEHRASQLSVGGDFNPPAFERRQGTRASGVSSPLDAKQ